MNMSPTINPMQQILEGRIVWNCVELTKPLAYILRLSLMLSQLNGIGIGQFGWTWTLPHIG